ncbi:MAG: adenylate/guanylate cyclase domain-containing protein [Spirochaetaceae bacterium]|jgi:class 3 adenylate cyclase/HAMP domain-containing protein|nr:adenylate/guanylate cyclase domain-containing protein [Spirochaetaceae bacterium]
MSIRSKIILVVLPLVVVTLILAGTASYFAAAKGITRITQRFFSFKVNELEKYTENQWALLVENNYAGRPDMVLAAENAVESYARSIILSDTELIFALDGEGTVVMATSEFDISADETAALRGLLEEAGDELFNASIGGTGRVIRAFYFTPFQWWVLLTEENTAFYRDVDAITVQTLVMIGAASAAALLMLFFFARLLTTPLGRVVNAMDRIIGSTDLSARVEVEYRDETGQLAHTFNLMIAELEKAYDQIKRYAFDAVLSRKKEQRIRQIFQKYVPKDLIDKFFAAPEAMLVGDNRVLAVLFSDIRSFTTISEGMAPEDLVNSLNRYFSGQVDIIMNRNGIVDKYIGDAIMAFWGAPVKHDDDALQSVLSGLDMIDALRVFNEAQRKEGKPEFHIGIGINYGLVTVGNIGSERKMDYTVIGDMVNLASRMEGLTKPYHQEILISDSIYGEIKGQLPTRLLDTVAVKGKTRGVKIYTVRRSITGKEERAWAVHNEGMAAYYRRSFGEAAAKFQEVLSLLPEDFIAKVLLARCKNYALTPPPEGWDGVEVMKTK